MPCEVARRYCCGPGADATVSRTLALCVRNGDTEVTKGPTTKICDVVPGSSVARMRLAAGEDRHKVRHSGDFRGATTRNRRRHLHGQSTDHPQTTHRWRVVCCRA